MKIPNIEKKYLIFIFPILIMGFFILSVFLPRNFSSGGKVIFNVEKGQSSKEIAMNLEKNGLILWGPVFRVYVSLRGLAGKLQAGTFELHSSENIPQIVGKLVSGNTIKIKITVPEGFTLKKIEERIGQYFEEISLSQFSPADFKEKFSFLNDVPVKASLEGFLFPDTYFFVPGTEDKKIAETFLENFDKKLAPELREEIRKQNKSVFEIITMASLVEKEVRTLEDKKIVSGIFWKRLKIKMALESCATIAYILNIDKWQYSFEDTRTVSPYNTYLNRGLPPGPISNPGIDSITAALYPQNSDYWYWLSTPEGKTIFSKTLEEHNIAKVKYLK